MPDADSAGLMRTSAISFTGSITRLHASTVAELPVDDRTSVVTVERVLHAPAAFRNLSGNDVTLQLADELEAERLREHAAGADAVVVGQVVALAKAGPARVQRARSRLVADRRDQAGMYRPNQVTIRVR